MAIDTIDVVVRLHDLRNFFAVPDVDPFAGEDIDMSGVDLVMETVRIQRGWRHRPVATRIEVPSSPESDALVPRIPQALASYCDRHIQHTERQLGEVWQNGRRALIVGVVFLALCLGLAAGIERLVPDNSLLSRLLVEGAIIAGWVGLWRPIELLLFEWWPYVENIRLYRKLRDMPVSVVTY